MVTTRSRITAPLLALTVAANILAGGSAGRAAAAPFPGAAASGAHALLTLDPGSPGLALRDSPLPRFSTSARSPPGLMRLPRTRKEPNAAKTQERR
jgi:hypothetical protein